MSDPLSVAAGIVGVITAAAQISSLLINFSKDCQDAPRKARVVLAEVSETSSILSLLQSALLGKETLNQSRISLTPVHQAVVPAVVIVTGCVSTFSELQELLDGLKSDSMTILDRLKWVRKETAIDSIIERLQMHKASLSLILTILNGHTMEDVKNSVDRLAVTVNKSYQEILIGLWTLESPEFIQLPVPAVSKPVDGISYRNSCCALKDYPWKSTDCDRVHDFQHWVAYKRANDPNIPGSEQVSCPMIWCTAKFPYEPTKLFDHIQNCEYLRSCLYWCPYCQIEESFECPLLKKSPRQFQDSSCTPSLPTLKDTDMWPPEQLEHASTQFLDPDHVSKNHFNFTFDADPQGSPAYRRIGRKLSGFSQSTGHVHTTRWSVLPDLSIGNVSNISRISLAITVGEIYNAGQYIDPKIQQPLYNNREWRPNEIDENQVYFEQESKSINQSSPELKESLRRKRQGIVGSKSKHEAKDRAGGEIRTRDIIKDRKRERTARLKKKLSWDTFTEEINEERKRIVRKDQIEYTREEKKAATKEINEGRKRPVMKDTANDIKEEECNITPGDLTDNRAIEETDATARLVQLMIGRFWANEAEKIRSNVF